MIAADESADLWLSDPQHPKTGFTFTAGPKVLLRHIGQGSLRVCLTVSGQVLRGACTHWLPSTWCSDVTRRLGLGRDSEYKCGSQLEQRDGMADETPSKP
jgi:hypothetical protein